MKDLIPSSYIAGTVAFLYKNIANHLLYYLGVTSFLYRVEASSLVLPLDKANTFSGAVIGLFTDFILLTWFTLLIAYILRTTGYDLAILKGALVGASSWLIIYGFFIHTGLLDLLRPTGIISGLTSIFFDVTMGIVSAYVLVYLDNRAKV